MTARERLAAIAARADAASVGPWDHYSTVHADAKVVGSSGHWPADEIAAVSSAPDDYGHSNAAFIAAARTDVPALVAFATAVLDLHSPWRIYDECDCTDDEKSDDETHVIADDIGRTCNLMYVICRECCCDGDDREYQTEVCASYHEHLIDPDARCSTVALAVMMFGGTP